MEWTRGLFSRLAASAEERALSAEEQETVRRAVCGDTEALTEVGKSVRLQEALGRARDENGVGVLTALVRRGHQEGAKAVCGWPNADTNANTSASANARLMGDAEEQQRFLEAAVAAVEAGNTQAEPETETSADTDGLRAVTVLVEGGVCALRLCAHAPFVHAALRAAPASLPLLRAIAARATPDTLDNLARADTHRRHLLHYAAALADRHMVAALLNPRRPTIPFATDLAGLTSFHAAIAAPYPAPLVLAVLELMLRHASQTPNVTSVKGLSLSHYCCIHKCPDALRLLMDIPDFYPLTFDIHGNSPLHFAAENADEACFTILAKDPRSVAGLHIPNNNNITPAQAAMQTMPSVMESLGLSPVDAAEKRLAIQIASDIHLEFYVNRDMEDFSDLIVPAAPYLALLGDLTVITGKLFVFQKFLDYVSPRFTRVFVLAGNHEYYKSKNLHESRAAFREFCDSFPNVMFMDRDECVVEDVAILGTTLWSYCPPYAEMNVMSYLNDYRYIYIESETPTKLTVTHTNEFHTENVNWLKQRIEHYTQEKKNILILTHHSPLLNIASSDPQFFYSPTNHAFCTDLREMMAENVKYWCYGHTHYFQDMQVGHTRVVSNPAGYVPVSQAYSPSFVVQM